MVKNREKNTDALLNLSLFLFIFNIDNDQTCTVPQL